MPSPIENAWQRPFREPTRRPLPWGHGLVLGLIAVLAGLVIYLRPFAAASYPTVVGEVTTARPLKTLELQPLTGFAKPLTLADLRGSVVVLHVWEPGSEGCFAGLSLLADLDRRYRSQPRLRVLCVACNRQGNGDASDLSVLSYETAVLMRQANMETASYTDRRGVTREAIAAAIEDDGLPATVVLDRRGQIRGVWHDLPDDARRAAASLVAKLLAEP